MRKRYILGAGMVFSLLGANNTFAVTFQNNVDVEFTFNSTLSISLSSADLLIANLAPGASASSNTITVSVDTNNITGYTLSATVGDGTTYTNDKLVNSSSNTYFDNLTSSSTLANFGNNKWGYALGAISSSSTYSGLVYNTNTIINATTNASGTAATGYTGTNNTSFTIAAKASDTQASGDYKNVIIFTVVANTTTMSINNLNYMQDFAGLTSSQKNEVITSMTTGTAYTLTDSRDGEDYYIAKLADGNVWMLDNLRLGGDSPIVLTNEDSNISSASWTLPASSNFSGGTAKVDTAVPVRSGMAKLAFNDISKKEKAVSFKLTAPEPDSCGAGANCTVAYNNADIKDTVVTNYGIGSGKAGVFYSYCAVSAGTKCVASNSDYTNTVYDICPIGWRLPTGGNAGEYEALYTSYNNDSNSFLSSLSPALAGYYTPTSGLRYQNSYISYWTSTYTSEAGGDQRHVLTVSNGSVDITNTFFRSFGLSVKCILNN